MSYRSSFRTSLREVPWSGSQIATQSMVPTYVSMESHLYGSGGQWFKRHFGMVVTGPVSYKSAIEYYEESSQRSTPWRVGMSFICFQNIWKSVHGASD